uniref:Uncharacterized protein n=1 Tax=Dicentrarchus labrax TaxID=13489 RepID=A0A8C4EC36_DICLA
PENCCVKELQILPVDCVDLMDSSGRVMNLEGKQQSLVLTSSVLAERQYYVLLRVCHDDTGGRKYVSLLNNFSQSHPELTGTISTGINTSKLNRASCWSNSCLE